MSRRILLSLALLVGLSMFAPPPAAFAKDTAAAPAATDVIDLNTATMDQLETLSGIGPAKAKAIVEGRPYTSLKDFESRNIVPASTVEKFKAQVTVARSKAKPATTDASTTQAPSGTAAKVDLNTATAAELETLPGVGPAKAKAIIEGRPYTSLKDFESRNIVSQSVSDKWKGQVALTKATGKPAATDTAASPAPATQPAGTVDLNTATADELQTLPGVGPAKAKAIIDGRPYSSLKDFVSRNIVTTSVSDKWNGQVMLSKATSKPAATDTAASPASKAKAKPATTETADEQNPPEPTGKIDLNSATADELEVLPGVGPVRAKAIVDGRPYNSVAQFESKGIIPAATFDKFKSAVEVVSVSGKAAAGQGTPGQAAAQRRIRMCGAQWRAAKAESSLPAGATWPQYWSQCNTALKQRGY